MVIFGKKKSSEERVSGARRSPSKTFVKIDDQRGSGKIPALAADINNREKINRRRENQSMKLINLIKTISTFVYFV